MLEIKFNTSEKVNFLNINIFSIQKKINVYNILKQAFDQNVLVDKENQILFNFIQHTQNFKNYRSQIFQDLFASFVIDKNFQNTFLEFGATNGIELSNTFILEQELGWSGTLVEPDIQWLNQLKKNRPKSKIIEKCIWKKSNEKLNFFSSGRGVLSTLEQFKLSDQETLPVNVKDRLKSGKNIIVETISLNDLIKEFLNDKCPSYISVDTEGSEFEILNAFDFSKYFPALFTVEHNFTNLEKKIDKLMISNGYTRIFKELTSVDAWYLSQTAMDKLRSH